MTAIAADLKSTRTLLIELHRMLLAVLKKDHEKFLGRVMAPTEWFQILIGDPVYEWLKPLNSLLADVDALSEQTQVSEADLVILRHELDTYFFKENDEVTSFNYHYRKLFAQNHEVMFTHGKLKLAVAHLPLKTPPLNADEIRRGWHKVSASKRKLLN